MVNHIRIFGVALALVLLSSTALAQQQCNPRSYTIDHLAEQYQEVPIAVGVTNAGTIVEVLSAGENKTWTIIVTTTNGISCLLAAGNGWRGKIPEPTGPDT